MDESNMGETEETEETKEEEGERAPTEEDGGGWLKTAFKPIAQNEIKSNYILVNKN